MNFSNLQSCIITIFVMLAVGFISQKFRILDQKGTRFLSTLIINVSLPAMLMGAISNTRIDFSVKLALELLCAAGTFLVITFLLEQCLTRLIARGRDDSSVHMAMHRNLGFLGFPLIALLFGEGALFYAAWFSIPIIIISNSFGIFLVSGGEGQGSLKTLFNPPVIASVVATVFFLSNLQIPVFVADALASIATFTVPGYMLIVGASLGNIPDTKRLKSWRFYVISIMTLLIRPTVVWLVLRIFIEDPILLGSAVVLSAVPVGIKVSE